MSGAGFEWVAQRWKAQCPNTTILFPLLHMLNCHRKGEPAWSSKKIATNRLELLYQSTFQSPECSRNFRLYGYQTWYTTGYLLPNYGLQITCTWSIKAGQWHAPCSSLKLLNYIQDSYNTFNTFLIFFQVNNLWTLATGYICSLESGGWSCG